MCFPKSNIKNNNKYQCSVFDQSGDLKRHNFAEDTGTPKQLETFILGLTFEF